MKPNKYSGYSSHSENTTNKQLYYSTKRKGALKVKGNQNITNIAYIITIIKFINNVLLTGVISSPSTSSSILSSHDNGNENNADHTVVRPGPLIGQCCEDGRVSMHTIDSTLWEIQLPAPLLYICNMDITKDGSDEMVVCGWDGMLYIYYSHSFVLLFLLSLPSTFVSLSPFSPLSLLLPLLSLSSLSLCSFSVLFSSPLSSLFVRFPFSSLTAAQSCSL